MARGGTSSATRRRQAAAAAVTRLVNNQKATEQKNTARAQGKLIVECHDHSYNNGCCIRTKIGFDDSSYSEQLREVGIERDEWEWTIAAFNAYPEAREHIPWLKLYGPVACASCVGGSILIVGVFLLLTVDFFLMFTLMIGLMFCILGLLGTCSWAISRISSGEREALSALIKEENQMYADRILITEHNVGTTERWLEVERLDGVPFVHPGVAVVGGPTVVSVQAVPVAGPGAMLVRPCPSCQTENDYDATFCKGCGARVKASCGGCGGDLAADAAFCSSCGAAVNDDETPPQYEKS